MAPAKFSPKNEERERNIAPNFVEKHIKIDELLKNGYFAKNMRCGTYLLRGIFFFFLFLPVAFAEQSMASYLEKNLGRKVSLTGVAKDAKLGAVLLMEGDVIYIAGKESWEPSLLDKKVRATGIVSRFEAPVAAKNEKGEWNAGVSTPETLYKLEKATVKEIK